MIAARPRAFGGDRRAKHVAEFIKLNSLIGEIYDASIDADLWHDVVKSIAEFVPGAFVNVFSQDATKKSAQRSAAFCRCRSSAAFHHHYVRI